MINIKLSKVLFSFLFLNLLFFSINSKAYASQYAYTNHNVSFRTEPSMKADVIKYVMYNNKLEVLKKIDEGWSEVKIDDYVGFVKSEFLDIEEGVVFNGSTVELTPWSQAKEIFTIGSTALVYDVYSGKSYNVKSFSNGLHADVEPVSTTDTAIMKETYGNVWKWDPRPVWVSINGHTMAASINGMPHGGGVNYSNGMNGQVCIHFEGSYTHNGNGSFARWHQNVLKEAFSASKE